MLYVLGAGAAYPETVIGNDLLAEVCPELSASAIFERTAIKERRTTLPLDYLKQTGNESVLEVDKARLVSGTDLALKASLIAIERAGIRPEDLGLVMGDTITPRQTTPSEGQRVADRLGLKIPAYDVVGSEASSLVHLSALLNWLPGKVPAYVLCLVSNCPTEKINYRKGFERLYFGDGAAAMVVSTRHPGKLQVQSSSFAQKHAAPNWVVFKTLYHMQANYYPEPSQIQKAHSDILKEALEKFELVGGNIKFIGTQHSPSALRGACSEFGIVTENHWCDVETHGNTIGVSHLGVLAQNWQNIDSGDAILLVQAGVGGTSGCVMLLAE